MSMAEITPRRERVSLRHDEIGGGKVKQAFRAGERYLKPGTILTAEEIMAWPYANRCALIERFIEVWPKEAKTELEGPIGYFIVHMGAGRFNVIKGIVLNDEPLDKDQAKELKAKAEGTPPPEPAQED